MEVNQGNTSQEEAILSKFRPSDLSCQSPRSKYHLWVFWSQEEASHLSSTNSDSSIQNHIKTVLCSLKDSLNADYLVQFWAPTTTMMGDQLLLTTSHQPFAFKGCINEDLIRYRKHSLDHTFVITDRDGDSVIGRVFKNQLPEFSQDVSYYSLKEHPHRDFALSCGITRIWACPVFGDKLCVGVLEFLSSSTMIELDLGSFVQCLRRAGLITTYTHQIRKQMPKCIAHEEDEIMEPLQQVCEAHYLPFACVWVRCRNNTSWSHGGSNSNMSDLVVSGPELFTYDRDEDVLFPSIVMRVGQGLIGNAFLSDKPFLCRDVTQLSMSQHPIAHTARSLGFAGCITICLQRISTGDRDYVLQFYLSLDMARSKQINDLFSSMLVILKQNFKKFEAVVVDSGEKLFTEVDKASIDGVFDSLRTSPTITDEVEPRAIWNEGEVLQANFLGHNLANGDFTNDGGDYVGREQRGKAIVLENNCLEKKSCIVSEEKRLEKKSKAHNQKESSCTYETLKQQFGRKLEDAAENLGVSRSTVKRWCRENNINRWPFPKRSKITSLPHIPKHMNEPIQWNVESISDSGGKGPSYFDVPANLTPKRDMNRVTVKATYKNDIIKFQLSFSSRMMDLVENVKLRLKLSEGTFAIKYLDNEGDHILIACDVDLQDCINSFITKEQQTTIKMLIETLL